LVAVPSVHASNWGSGITWPCDTSPKSQCVANNVSHYYWVDPNVSLARANASTRGIQVIADGSEINRFVSVSRLNSDVIVITYTGTGIEAFAWGACIASGAHYGGSDPERWCWPQMLTWNLWNVAADKVNLPNEYEYIGCHEMGHTVGLRHAAAPSCMQTTGKPTGHSGNLPTDDFPTTHDYGQLNSHYPI
jgi:hypothetical protein